VHHFSNLTCQYRNGRMKPIILLAFISTIFISCKKDTTSSFQNKGVITGIDMRLCPCAIGCPCICGGLDFHFIDTSYTANIPLDNPVIFKLGSNAQFPIYVQVNWQNTTRCGTTAIKITEFKIQ
jgi:hypothetical protein